MPRADERPLGTELFRCCQPWRSTASPSPRLPLSPDGVSSKQTDECQQEAPPLRQSSQVCTLSGARGARLTGSAHYPCGEASSEQLEAPLTA
jgi:hypothetical protein